MVEELQGAKVRNSLQIAEAMKKGIYISL